MTNPTVLVTGGTGKTGQYRVEIPHPPEYAKSGGSWRRGVVVNFPRLRLGPIRIELQRPLWRHEDDHRSGGREDVTDHVAHGVDHGACRHGVVAPRQAPGGQATPAPPIGPL